MDATLTSPRTGGAGHPPEPRELPILFHLMDVSRPRATSQAVAAATPAPVESLKLAPLESQPSIEIKPVLDASRFPDLSPLVFPPIDSPSSAAPSDQPIKEPAAEAQSTDSSGSESSPPANDAPQASQSLEPTVTPAKPPETRRKPKTAPSEDWFASHGKFIAIAFALALVGTIYFARTNRRSSASAEAKIDEHPPEALQIVIDEKAGEHDHAAHSPSTASTPAKTASSIAETSSEAAKTELHAPSLPQFAGPPAGETPSTSNNLFTFPAKKQVEQVAARPELPAAPDAFSNASAPRTPADQAVSPAPGIAPAGPSLAPAYPVTSSAAPAYPVAAPAAGGYPATGAPPLASAPPNPGAEGAAPPAAATAYPAPPSNPQSNYRSQFQPAGQYQPAGSSPAPPPGAGAPQGWIPPASDPGMPPQYPLPDTTARGPRYERTGSGNY